MDKHRLICNKYLHVILLILATSISYSNSFDVPFQFDDFCYIVDNPLVKNFDYFNDFHKSKATASSLASHAFNNRYIGFLTFALNIKAGGLDETGMHAVNLTIHIINVLLLYAFVSLLFKTPILINSALIKHSSLIALFTAVLFATHPVQTQAVTYITQRFASLVSMFYLMSLTAYIAARISRKITSRFILYALAVFSALLAMKTKENSLTLPLAITLLELMFFRTPFKKRLILLTPILLTLFVIPVSYTVENMNGGDFQKAIGDSSRLLTDMSREHYLYTQFRVIFTYFRLLAFPINQNLDYDYPIYTSFFDPGIYMACIFNLAVFGLGLYLLKRSKNRPELRLPSFGIFFYCLSLSVESSIFPLGDIIFEHRIYLPSIGFFIFIVNALFLLKEFMESHTVKTTVISFLIALPLLFVPATYSRNNVWRTDLGFWKDVVAKSPDKARPRVNLGKAYRMQGMLESAEEQYSIALKLNPHDAIALNNLGVLYGTEGRVEEAIGQFTAALRVDPEDEIAHYNLGWIYKSAGKFSNSIEHYTNAIDLNPAYAAAHTNLGSIYAIHGYTERAVLHFETALRINPYCEVTHNNIGLALADNGFVEKAIHHYKRAVALKPDYVSAHINLCYAYKELGLAKEIERHLEIIGTLEPALYDTHKEELQLD